MVGDRPDFFARLSALPSGQAASRAFDRILRAGVPAPLPGWHAKLYRSLVSFLLEALELPASPGREHWEWASLYRAEQEVDPHYFGSRDISQRLAACPPMAIEKRNALLGTLERYFAWRREPLRVGLPYPLLDTDETLRWAAVFPRELAWRAAAVLREVGLYPIVSAAGFRAWRRFTAGEFGASLTAETLTEWNGLCAAGAADTESHRRDFAAAAFAGEWPSFGLTGPCGAVPDCPACPLRAECAWAQAEHRATGELGESLALIRRDGAAEAPTERLLQASFGFSARDAVTWRERLARMPLRALTSRTVPELETWLEGLPPRAEQLQALLELARRLGEERLMPGAVFRGGDDVFRHFRMRLRDAKQEHFYLILLDPKHRYQGEVAVSQGTMERALIHPRDVFGAAVRERAAAVVVVHNHPSGDPTPSTEDIRVTQRLVEAGSVLGIPLVDHIVLGEGRYLSFSESGLLGRP